MIYFEKSQPAPDCLEKEKNKEISGTKKNGNYKCGCVSKRIEEDFKNKCYICESQSFTTINVEHFKPHHNGKYIDLKFDWNNLFFACGYCNTTKSAIAKYDNILNCTDLNDTVEQKLKQTYHPFPRYEVVIEALTDEEKVINTRDLLNAVFNGTRKLKSTAAQNLCNNLKKEIRKYQDDIEEYLDAVDLEHKENCRLRIKSHLNSASAFTAFKRQMIRDYPKLSEVFGSYLVTEEV